MEKPPRFPRHHWKELVEREMAGDTVANHIEMQDAYADQEHARAERLTGELDKELQRRFDGNRIASQEHAEDIHALQAQLTEAKEALDRAHKVFAHEMDERAKEAHESQMYRGLLKSADGYLTDHDENCTLHLAIKARLYGE